MQAVELTPVELARVLIRDGLEAQGAREVLSERCGIEGLDRNPCDLGLAGTKRQRALERDGSEDEEREEQGADQLFHNASLAVREWVGKLARGIVPRKGLTPRTVAA